MTSPPAGVKPMVVSTERPSIAAHRLAPAPRWAMTTRPGGRRPRWSDHVLVAAGRGSRSDAHPGLAASAGRARVNASGRVSGGRRCRSRPPEAGRARPAAAARMPARAAGWCSGASGTSVLQVGQEPDRRPGPAHVVPAPPCTTRWPMASGRSQPLGGQLGRHRAQIGRRCRARRRSGTASARPRGRAATVEQGQLERRRAGVHRQHVARTRRTRSAPASRRPGPVPDLGHVLEVLAHVGVVAFELVVAVLGQLGRAGRDAGAPGAAPRWPGGSGSCSLSTTMSNGVVVVPCSLVAAHVEALGVGLAVHQPVHRARVAVEGEHHVGVLGEQLDELARGHAVGMVGRRVEPHQVDHVDEPEHQLGHVLGAAGRPRPAAPWWGCRRRRPAPRRAARRRPRSVPAHVQTPAPRGAVRGGLRRRSGTAAAVACR